MSEVIFGASIEAPEFLEAPPGWQELMLAVTQMPFAHHVTIVAQSCQFFRNE